MLIRPRNVGSMSNVMLSIMAKENTNMENTITSVQPLGTAKPNGSAAKKPSEVEQLKAQVAALEAKLAAAAKGSTLQMKVSEKKAASLIGLQRFPVTLYYGQWQRIIANIDSIKAWLEANKASLSMEKGDKE